MSQVSGAARFRLLVVRDLSRLRPQLFPRMEDRPLITTSSGGISGDYLMGTAVSQLTTRLLLHSILKERPQSLLSFFHY